MRKGPSRDHLRVAAMVQAAEEAKQDSTAGKASFLEPGLVQKAVLLDLIHLTESAERTSAALKELNPQIEWRRLSRLRNQGLVHDYSEVDLEELWVFLREELPGLRRRLDRIRFPPAGDR